MVRIFALSAREERIGVAVHVCEVAVLTILMLFVNQIDARDFFKQRPELCKERFTKVKLHSIFQRVPLVTPPLSLIVNDMFILR